MPEDRSSYTPTTLGYAILGLLSHGPMTGYQIRRQFETTAIGRYSSSPGSIYPALRRLQAAGLVAQPTEGGAFELTSEGRTTLQEWLLTPVTREDMERDDDELILRFAFMTDLVPRAAIQAFLEAFQAEAAAQAARLQSFRRGPGSDLPLCGGLAVDRGVEGYRANARWAAAALVKVRAAGPAKRGRTTGDPNTADPKTADRETTR